MAESDTEVSKKINQSLGWVAMAASFVAFFDVIALVILLKFFLTDADYGVATVVLTLFAALELAAELGITAAIIQRDDHTQTKLSTLFWLNVMFAMVFYGAIYFSAPLLANLYDEPLVETMFRVAGITLIIRSFYGVHQALVRKSLDFKKLQLVRVIGNFAEFATKIISAALGAGPWCFVWGLFARVVVSLIGVPLLTKFRPSFVFRFGETVDYLKFGLRASGGELLFHVYSNIDYQIVTAFFGTAATGIYRAAYELVLEPVRFISGVVTGVALPAFSRLKHDKAAVNRQLLAFIRQNLLIVLPFVAVICLVAEDLLVVIFKESYWVGGDAARLLALVGLLRALSYLIPPLFDGLGKPELTLRYQGLAAIVIPGMFVAFAHFLGDELGMTSVALAWVAGYPIAFALLLWMSFRLTGLPMAEFFARTYKIVLSVLIAAAVGYVALWLVADYSAGTRVAAVVSSVTVSILVLYWRVENVSIASTIRSMRT